MVSLWKLRIEAKSSSIIQLPWVWYLRPRRLGAIVLMPYCRVRSGRAGPLEHASANPADETDDGGFGREEAAVLLTLTVLP